MFSSITWVISAIGSDWGLFRERPMEKQTENSLVDPINVHHIARSQL